MLTNQLDGGKWKALVFMTGDVRIQPSFGLCGGDVYAQIGPSTEVVCFDEPGRLRRFRVLMKALT
jgi:hypothetical protein